MELFHEFNLPEALIDTMEKLISATIEDRLERSMPLCSLQKKETGYESAGSLKKREYREITTGEIRAGNALGTKVNPCTGPGQEMVGTFHTHVHFPEHNAEGQLPDHDFSYVDYAKGMQLAEKVTGTKSNIVCLGKPDHSIICQQLNNYDPEFKKVINDLHIPDTTSGHEHATELIRQFYTKEETVRAPEGVTIHGIQRDNDVSNFAKWYGGYKNAVDKAVEKGLDFDSISHHPVAHEPDTKPLSPEVQKIKDSISYLLSTVHEPSNKTEIIKKSIKEHQFDWRTINDDEWTHEPIVAPGETLGIWW